MQQSLGAGGSPRAIGNQGRDDGKHRSVELQVLSQAENSAVAADIASLDMGSEGTGSSVDAQPASEVQYEVVKAAAAASMPMEALGGTGAADGRHPWLHEVCVVCLEKWEAGARVTILPCMHRLHEDCATGWARA